MSAFASHAKCYGNEARKMLFLVWVVQRKTLGTVALTFRCFRHCFARWNGILPNLDRRSYLGASHWLHVLWLNDIGGVSVRLGAKLRSSLGNVAFSAAEKKSHAHPPPLLLHKPASQSLVDASCVLQFPYLEISTAVGTAGVSA